MFPIIFIQHLFSITFVLVLPIKYCLLMAKLVQNRCSWLDGKVPHYTVVLRPVHQD